MSAPESTLDYVRAPILAVYEQSQEQFLHAEELHDWATARSVKCGHTRDLVQSCRVCRGTILAISLLDGGAPVVRLLPR